jgi:hypothetical protein
LLNWRRNCQNFFKTAQKMNFLMKSLKLSVYLKKKQPKHQITLNPSQKIVSFLILLKKKVLSTLNKGTKKYKEEFKECNHCLKHFSPSTFKDHLLSCKIVKKISKPKKSQSLFLESITATPIPPPPPPKSESKKRKHPTNPGDEEEEKKIRRVKRVKPKVEKFSFLTFRFQFKVKMVCINLLFKQKFNQIQIWVNWQFNLKLESWPRVQSKHLRV